MKLPKIHWYKPVIVFIFNLGQILTIIYLLTDIVSYKYLLASMIISILITIEYYSNLQNMRYYISELYNQLNKEG